MHQKAPDPIVNANERCILHAGPCRDNLPLAARANSGWLRGGPHVTRQMQRVCIQAFAIRGELRLLWPGTFVNDSRLGK